MAEGLSARFSAAAVFQGPYKAGSFFFVENCNKNLDTLVTFTTTHRFMSILQLVLVNLFSCNVANIVFLCLTHGGYDAQFDQNPGRLSLRK